jgi:predicted dehydrogenase
VVSPIRVALVGLGDIALRAHLPALLAAPAVDLVALVEIDEERRGEGAACAPGVPVVGSVDPVLADPAVDAVVVATPAWVTAGLARRALEAGKYVLAEKPLAPTLAEQVAFRELGSARDRLQIGLTYRHHPAVDRVRRLVADGSLGTPLYVQCTLADERSDPTGDPEHYAKRRQTLEHGPPVVFDGIHRCDQLNLILGETPASIAAWGLTTSSDFASPNVNGALLRYESGALVRLEVIWLVPSLPPSQFVLTGPRGRAELEPATFTLSLEVGGELETVAAERDKSELCFELQLERFVDACRRGAAPVPGLEESIAASELAERIARALQAE